MLRGCLILGTILCLIQIISAVEPFFRNWIPYPPARCVRADNRLTRTLKMQRRCCGGGGAQPDVAVRAASLCSSSISLSFNNLIESANFLWCLKFFTRFPVFALCLSLNIQERIRPYVSALPCDLWRDRSLSYIISKDPQAKLSMENWDAVESQLSLGCVVTQ